CAAGQGRAEVARRRSERLVSAEDLFRGSGAATPGVAVDRLTMSSTLRLARAEMRQSEGEADGAWQDLDALVHLHETRPPVLDLAVLDPGADPDGDALVVLAAERGFEVRRKRLELGRRERELRLTRSEPWAGLAVGPFYESAVARSRESTVGVGVTVPLPLWNRKRGDVEAASARTDRARAELAQAREAATHGARAWAARLRTARLLCRELPLAMLEEMEHLGELAERQFAQGRIGVAALLAAEEQVMRVSGGVLEAHADAVEALVELRLVSNPDGVMP
ncbi:MAG: TolC family protein, partial [bacterium]